MKSFFSISFFCFRSLLVSVKTRSPITSNSVNFVGDNTNNGGKITNCLLLMSLSFFVNLNGQKEANQWFFERYNGLDFNGDTVKYLEGCQFGKSESSSSICDKNGNVLFYSNGITLYNRYHKIVKNGTDLGLPINFNETSSALGTLLLKHPDNDSLIYLFCSDFQGRNGGLVYSIINLRCDNDSGEVIIKKIKLTNQINEPIIAANHQNGKDIIIAIHGYNNSFFHLYVLTKNGLNICRLDIEIGGKHNNNAQKIMKFSSDGKFIAHSNYSNGLFEVLKIDNDFSLKSVYKRSGNYSNAYEFSPNSDFIYFGYYDSIVQFNIKKNKRIRITTTPSGFSPAQLQLSPDGKIFGAVIDSKDIFIIDRPNEEGDSCRIIIKKNFLLNTNVTAMPNFNQSYFYNPAINYSYEMNCIKNSIQFWGKDTFGANNHNWYIRKIFGANNYQLIGNSKDINYTFADTGTYEVRYIASNGNKIDTVIKSIVFYDKIKQDFLGKDTIFAVGDAVNKTLFAPTPNHCVRWQDSSSLNSYTVNTKGTYICKVTNQAFCEVWDTIVINECINNLTQPSLFRSRDTLRTWHLSADSFVWYRNNQIYKVTKQPFLALTDTGTYRVEAAKKGHCNRGSVGQLLVNKLSVKGFRIEDLGIRVFPNPSSGLVKIEGEVGFSLEIRDVLGRVIEQLKYEDQNSSPLLGRGVRGEVFLPKGIYFFHFDVGAYRSVEKVVVY